MGIRFLDFLRPMPYIPSHNRISLNRTGHLPGGMAKSPNDDTEPRVQQLVIGLCSERDIGPQGLAGAGLCV